MTIFKNFLPILMMNLVLEFRDEATLLGYFRVLCSLQDIMWYITIRLLVNSDCVVMGGFSCVYDICLVDYWHERN